MKRKRQDIPVPKDFFKVINSNDSEGLALLLSMKADVNVTDRDGWTPLHLAAHNGNAQMIAQLLTREDLNINAVIPNDDDLEDDDYDSPDEYENCTALDIAALRDDPPTARRLLAANAAITCAEKKGDFSTLELAARDDSLGVVKLLLEVKAPVNLPYDHDESPLHIAVSHNVSPAIVKYLLDAKANMEVKNSAGETPVDMVHRQLLQSAWYLVNINAAKLYWLQQAMQTRRAITFLMGLHARVGVRSSLAQLTRRRGNLFDPQVLRLVLVMMGVNCRKRRIQFSLGFLMGFHPRAGGIEPLQAVRSPLQVVSRLTLFQPEMLRLPLQLGGAISSRSLSRGG